MMEAADWSSSFSFRPSDENLVVDFLRPLALGLRAPDGFCIIADDPYRIEPSILLAGYGRDGERGGAYFVAQKTMASSRGRRRRRTVGSAGTISGTWRVQYTEEASSREHKVTWLKRLLSYQSANDSSGATGYVMYEYELFKDGSGRGGGEGSRKGDTYDIIICRVKMNEREISRIIKRRKNASAILQAAAAPSRSTGPGSSVASTSNSHGTSEYGSAHSDAHLASAPSPASPPPASSSLPGPTTLPEPDARRDPFAVAGTAPGPCSEPSSASLPAAPRSFLELLLGGLAACTAAPANLNPSRASSMLDSDHNATAYYSYPNSRIELLPPSCATPEPPAVPFEIDQKQQQQLHPPLMAAADGAYPALDFDDLLNMETTADEILEIFDIFDKEAEAEQQKQQQQQQQQQPQPESNSNADAAAARGDDDLTDRYLSIDSFADIDDIDDVFTDPEIERMVMEISEKPVRVPAGGGPLYFS